MRKRRWRLRLGNEQGQTLFQAALFLPILMVMLGLVVDGGLVFANYRRAQIAADTAAHAASLQVSREVFYESNSVALAWEKSVAMAREYAEYNAGGRMQVVIRQVTVGPNWVRVEADAVLPTIFFRFLGVPDICVRVVGEAYPAYGIDQEWQ
jgi:hypothetical protein